MDNKVQGQGNERYIIMSPTYNVKWKDKRNPTLRKVKVKERKFETAVYTTTTFECIFN